MNNKEILYSKLGDNILSLHKLEEEMSMMELAIYEKSLNSLRETKIDELNSFLKTHIKSFNQDATKFMKEIDTITEKYLIEINRFTQAYNDFYTQIFKFLCEANNEQKKSITRLLKIKDCLLQNNISVQEEEVLNRELIACVQKKLNYSAIIEECRARIKWCIEKAQTDFNQIFNVMDLDIKKYDKNIIFKIKNMFNNIFFGKNNCKSFLYNFSIDTLKKIKNNNKKNITELCIIQRGIQKQIKLTKAEILKQYNAQLIK